MEEQANFIEPLVEKAENWGKTSFELLKLQALQKSIFMASSIILFAMVAFFLTLFFLIANIGIGLWLGELMSKTYFGFFALASFYAIFALIVYFFMRKSIKNSINNLIISHLFN